MPKVVLNYKTATTDTHKYAPAMTNMNVSEVIYAILYTTELKETEVLYIYDKCQRCKHGKWC